MTAEITVNGVTRPYEYIPYPKWIKVDGKNVLVKDKEEHKQYDKNAKAKG